MALHPKVTVSIEITWADSLRMAMENLSGHMDKIILWQRQNEPSSRIEAIALKHIFELELLRMRIHAKIDIS